MHPKTIRMTIENTPKAVICVCIFTFMAFVCPKFSTLNAQSSITGKVWLDLNYDGNISTGEQGIPDVPVFLTTCSGQFVNAVYSDVNGDYTFSNLPSNSYKLFYNISSLGPLYKFTVYGSQTDNKAQANGFTFCQLTTEGVYSVHGGITAIANIGDKVWEDTDYDGTQDPNEPGIPNIMVQLVSASDGTVRAQTQSLPNGSYHFNNVNPGLYYVAFGVDTTYRPTIIQPDNNTNSDVSGDNGPNTTGTFFAGAGQNITHIDGGFYQCARLCGTVFFDQNQNDTLDIFENGINGLTIELWRVTESDTSIFTTTQTQHKAGTPSDDGFYTFCVSPGFYYIKIIIPQEADLVASIPFQAELDNHNSLVTHNNGPNTTNTIWVGSGTDNCDIDGGFYCGSSITARVWFDENENGLREAGEATLADVQVFLYDQNHMLIDVGVTLEDGVCKFDSLKAGKYFVYCSGGLPGLTFTVPHAGNEQNDSDIDNTFGPGTSGRIGVSECSDTDVTGIGFRQGSILPLVWGDINAAWIVSNNAQVRWAVFSETDIDHYRIMTSADDGKTWTGHGEIDAINKQIAESSYHFIFETPADDILVRVVAMGYDGTEMFSPTVRLSREQSTRWDATPNPAQDYLEIRGNKNHLITGGPYTVQLISSSGVKIYEQTIPEGAAHVIDVSTYLPGLYAVLVTENGRVVRVINIVVKR